MKVEEYQLDEEQSESQAFGYDTTVLKEMLQSVSFADSADQSYL